MLTTRSLNQQHPIHLASISEPWGLGSFTNDYVTNKNIWADLWQMGLPRTQQREIKK